MVIGLDCDEVLRQFVKALQEKYHKDFPDHWMKPVTAWGLHPFFELGEKIYDYIWDAAVEEIFINAPPFPGAREFICDLQRLGHHVHIITAQPREPSRQATIIWFEKNNIPWDSFSFCSEKHRVDCDIYLDDRQETLEILKLHGKFAVAMDRKWNEAWSGARVKSFKDFIDLLPRIPVR